MAEQRIIAATSVPLPPINDADLVRWATDVSSFLVDLAAELREFASRVYPREYTTGTLPTASKKNEGEVAYVSDGGAGAVFRGSNSTAWVNLG